ncbi:hypothetical protein GU243_03735 [Pseudarthrobacter psychrotolerans]|uniref:Uncharacterized protein n=1 Tax=Pseudarthrobacter psychrotolerans TaxID=2697569 RepID=A0A6P1NIS7_9MICC|nr:hypothetical protein [Pseudarthrobacter psychrotolerans]QHK19013.1 hypothetical protein GU243_03735 [Pseudarthrobacter psychrotolerans]
MNEPQDPIERLAPDECRELLARTTICGTDRHILNGDVPGGPGPSGAHGAATVIAIDPDEGRLARAREFGATDTVNPGWI